MLGKMKVAILALMVVEMSLFSGVFYGFNSLIPIYKDFGVFSQYCETQPRNESIRCAAQETYFGRAFSTWIIVQALMSFVLGMVFDRFGIRIIKVIAAICLMGGFLCFAFTPIFNWLLFIAGSLLTMSAHCLALSNIGLTVIFAGFSNMLVSIISSLYDVSAIVMTMLKVFTDLGAPFWLLCIIHASIGVIIILGSLTILKNRANEVISKDKGEEVNIESINTESNPEGNKHINDLYNQSVEETFPTVKACVLSPEYLIQMAYFAIMLFRFTFFLSQMSSHFSYLFPTDQAIANHLLSVSNTFFIGSIFISPIFGVLLDKYQKYTIKSLAENKVESPREIYNRVNGCFFVPSIICSCAMIVSSSLMFVSNQYSFYVVFSSITVMKSLLFAINASYIFSAFPKKYFGTLIGAVFLTTGFLNLLQQVIIPFAAADSRPDLVNYILLGVCLTTLAHGFYLKFKK